MKIPLQPSNRLGLCLLIATALSVFTLWSANAALDPVKNLDPCTKAKRQLDAAIQMHLAALRSALSEGIQMDRLKAEELWNGAAAEKAVVRIRDGYKGAASLSEEQISKMAAKDVSDYKASLAPKEVQRQLAVISRQASRPDIATAEQQVLVDAKDARAALDTACGKGDIQTALRIAGDFVQKRWDSMSTEQEPWDKVIKFATDISMRDFYRYGLLGGKNSDARKLFVKVQREVDKVMDKRLGLAPLRKQFAKVKIAGVTWEYPLGRKNALFPKAASDTKKKLRKWTGIKW